MANLQDKIDEILTKFGYKHFTQAEVDDDKQDDDDFDDDNENLLDLQKQMNDAIALENYKKAELFKKKIAKYLKKRND